MRRKGVPCGCTDNGGCCGLKEKLAVLWDRTIGSILRINGVSPDGDGDFAIEAGDNINITETGTGNGIRIDTTGGVSYYDSGDVYVNVDNNDLEITVNAGVTGGLALQDDLDTVTGAVNSILDGTTVVPEATDATNATNATYLGSNSANVGSDTKPVKIVNGQAVAVTNDLADYVPYQKTIYYVGWGVNTPTQGVITYRRTGHKKGILTGMVHIDTNSRSTPYHQINITNLNNAGFGVTFKAPSAQTFSGVWNVSNDGADANTAYGYGTCVSVYTNGDIAFGRYYTSDGQYGGWSDSMFSDRFVTFTDVEIEEL